LKNIKISLYDCLVNQTPIEDAILSTETPYLNLLPGHLDLVGAEIELINHTKREHLLTMALEPIAGSYDFIIIDCSPSLGLITVNALAAAKSVIIPVQCEYFALEGLGKLLNTIKIVQSRINTGLKIEGILMTMYDGRLRLSNQVVEEIKNHFNELVFSTLIHRNTKLGEAPGYGKPVLLYDADCSGSVNYLNLAKEILQKNNMTKLKTAVK
ncbi:MAG: chromosome partitioning protein ParA, partial [Chitinophagia bacterium]|nr:chromosome partitioning protein ParA [Chitinophagia bacterium]